ncbi:MAG: methylenetetrahydrofolate reductase [Leifsonia xyli]|nr:MAG: methylenetetrahydrofolate reductase [Leifsonia xyli]
MAFGVGNQKTAERVVHGAASPVAGAIAALAANLSIETSPKEALRGVDGLRDLPADTRVFITRLPTGSFEDTLAAAVKLRERGFSPVPHVTARTTPDAATLAYRLKRLIEEGGVREILLVAGSNDRPEGVFDNTLDILSSGVIEGSGLVALNVAGHPEGHPNADEATLRRALDAKNEFAVRTGLPVTLVTQFFFDAAPVIAWEKTIRAQGNLLPIDPGLHGVTGVPSLLKHALACGVGASVKALGSHSGGLIQFVQMRSPEGLIHDLAMAKIADPGSLFRNAHFFPLGGFFRTVKFCNALREGRFSLSETEGLSVPS